MKKTAILALMLAFTAALPACGNTPADGTDTTVNLIDKYTEPPKVEEVEIPEGFVIPTGYTYETEYKYSPDGDNLYGIYPGASQTLGSAMAIGGDRLYYSKSGILSYISVKDGKCYTVCPDPLCGHTQAEGCQFLGLGDLLLHPEKDYLLFGIQTYYIEKQRYNNICAINEKDGSIKRVFGNDVEGSEQIGAIFLKFIVDDKLYFTVRHLETETNEEGKVVEKSVDSIFTMDVNTYEVNMLDNKFGTGHYGQCIISSDKYMLFVDYDMGTVTVTDLNQENEKLLLKFDPHYCFIDNCYFDAVTDEFYFLLVSRRASDGYSEGPEEGNIYRLDNKLNFEKLDMPTDKIPRFSLTRDYIYFAIYEPVELGMMTGNHMCIMEDGGKLYRIKRDGSSEYELVYDGGLELLSDPYFNTYILGDYIYFCYTTLHNGPDGTIMLMAF